MWEISSRYGSAGDSGKDHNKKGEVLTWVSELMKEHDVRALPRTPDQLGGLSSPVHNQNSRSQAGKAYDSRDVWELFGLAPIRAGLD